MPIAARQVFPPPVPAARQEAPEPPAVPAAQVEQAQLALAELGYNPGLADGVLGPQTEAAVRAFQETEGLKVDGRVSARLNAALDRARKIHKVSQVQRRLAALGFDPGEVDGRMGPQTRKAIEAFESASGQPNTGELTPELLELLAKAEAERVQWADEESNPAASPDAAGLAEVAPAAGTNSEEAPPRQAEASAPAEPVAFLSAQEVEAADGERERTEVASTSAVEALPQEQDRSKRIILPGDKVRLRIGPEMKEVREFPVDVDGNLTLPEGVTVKAAGLTPKELEELVMVKLVEIYLMGLEVDVVPQSRIGQSQSERAAPDQPQAGE